MPSLIKPQFKINTRPVFFSTDYSSWTKKSHVRIPQKRVDQNNIHTYRVYRYKSGSCYICIWNVKYVHVLVHVELKSLPYISGFCKIFTHLTCSRWYFTNATLENCKNYPYKHLYELILACLMSINSIFQSFAGLNTKNYYQTKTEEIWRPKFFK